MIKLTKTGCLIALTKVPYYAGSFISPNIFVVKGMNLTATVLEELLLKNWKSRQMIYQIL